MGSSLVELHDLRPTSREPGMKVYLTDLDRSCPQIYTDSAGISNGAFDQDRHRDSLTIAEPDTDRMRLDDGLDFNIEPWNRSIGAVRRLRRGSLQ